MTNGLQAGPTRGKRRGHAAAAAGAGQATLRLRRAPPAACSVRRAFAMCTVCCSMASWMVARSASLMPSNCGRGAQRRRQIAGAACNGPVEPRAAGGCTAAGAAHGTGHGAPRLLGDCCQSAAALGRTSSMQHSPPSASTSAPASSAHWPPSCGARRGRREARGELQLSACGKAAPCAHALTWFLYV